MKIVFKIIKIILVVIFFVIAIGMSILLLNTHDEFGVTQFDNTSLLIMGDEISSPKYEKGDLVLVNQEPIENYNVGDEIFIFRINDNKKVSIELGFIGEVYAGEDAISLENGATYSSKFIAGKATDVYEGFGTYLSILQSTWVFFFIIVVPCFLIFIYQIYALIIEIKYGSDDAPKSSKEYQSYRSSRY